MELGCDEASKQRPDTATLGKWLCNASEPNINVVGGSIELQQLAGQVVVVQHPTQLFLILGLRQTTEPPPGVVALRRKIHKVSTDENNSEMMKC